MDKERPEVGVYKTDRWRWLAMGMALSGLVRFGRGLKHIFRLQTNRVRRGATQTVTVKVTCLGRWKGKITKCVVWTFSLFRFLFLSVSLFYESFRTV